jgi:type III pantothenate kinase
MQASKANLNESEQIAVDIGNSRMKLGLFARRDLGEAEGGLPQPTETFDLAIDHATGDFDGDRLRAWNARHVHAGARWKIASVHRAAASRLAAEVSAWSEASGVESLLHPITYRELPLVIRVDEPAGVGIDRLVAGFAADRIRRRGRAAIVVDLGTAITVDLIDDEGAFCGGAILPGIALSARALEEHTDALPRIGLDHLEKPPAPVGKSTVPAIESGLYWGAVGAVRELISQMSAGLPAAPDVFLTGGASQHVAELLAANSPYTVRHLPHLVLSGIALVQP